MNNNNKAELEELEGRIEVELGKRREAAKDKAREKRGKLRGICDQPFSENCP